MRQSLMHPLVVLLAILPSSLSVIDDDCARALDDFAIFSADFISCSISNARPIHMCTSCFGAYNGVQDSHASFLEISESDNVTCKDRLINLDRLEIIEAAYLYVTGLWANGACENCFEPNRGVAMTLSNETATFQQLYNKMDSCLSNFYDDDNKTYSSDVCTNCSSQYYQMNVFYDNIKRKHGDGRICMDVVDAMNTTQNLWSGMLKCGEDSITAEIPLIAACACFLLLPVVFYVAAWKSTAATSAPVSRQKRLSSRFIQRFRSRTGSLLSQLRY